MFERAQAGRTLRKHSTYLRLLLPVHTTCRCLSKKVQSGFTRSWNLIFHVNTESPWGRWGSPDAAPEWSSVLAPPLVCSRSHRSDLPPESAPPQTVLHRPHPVMFSLTGGARSMKEGGNSSDDGAWVHENRHGDRKCAGIAWQLSQTQGGYTRECYEE